MRILKYIIVAIVLGIVFIGFWYWRSIGIEEQCYLITQIKLGNKWNDSNTLSTQEKQNRPDLANIDLGFQKVLECEKSHPFMLF